MKDVLKKMAVAGARQAGTLAVTGVSKLLKKGMEERDMDASKIDALGTVTEVCQDMVPDMADNAVSTVFAKVSKKTETEEVAEEETDTADEDISSPERLEALA